jgi:hypothetical protein
VKKTVEALEPGEVVDTPVVKKEEPEVEAESAEVPKADAEELPSSQISEEMTSSQQSASSGNVEGIDGFEVIDNVEGESEDDSDCEV